MPWPWSRPPPLLQPTYNDPYHHYDEYGAPKRVRMKMGEHREYPAICDLSKTDQEYYGQCDSVTECGGCACEDVRELTYKCVDPKIGLGGSRKQHAKRRVACVWRSTGKKVQPQGCRYKKLIYVNDKGELRVRSVSVNKNGVRVARYIKF